MPTLKKISLKLILPCLLLTILMVGCQQEKNQEVASTVDEEATQMESKQLRHVVLFKFKEDADSILLKNVEVAFAALPSKIPEILSFEWGLNNSPEGLNKGLTHCYLLSFESEANRDSYLVHPDHLEFVALVGELVADVTVVDYWTGE